MNLKEFFDSTGHFEWLSLIQVFIILPYYYCMTCVDVHKEYAELIKNAPTHFKFTIQLKKQIENDLHLFNLDWWLVVAITALFIGLLSSSSIAARSTIFNVPAICYADMSHLNNLAALGGTPSENRDFVQKILVIYVMLVGLLFAFFIAWGRVVTVGKLRDYHYQFRSKPSKTRALLRPIAPPFIH